MARTLGRNARNRLWEGLGDGKSAAELKRMERAKEKHDWQEEELNPRPVPRSSNRKKRKRLDRQGGTCDRHKRIPVEGNNCHWKTERWRWSWSDKVRIYTSWTCECHSLCTKCGNKKHRVCYHEDLKEATRPEVVGFHN